MSNLLFKKLNDQLLLIKTNNKYPDGTNIELYLKNINNNFILTDLGFTVLWLLNLGFKISNSNKIDFLLENNKHIQNFYFYGGELILNIDNGILCIDQQIKLLIEICNKLISSYINKVENES